MICVVNDMVRMKGAKHEIEVETIEILNELYKHGRTKENLLEMVELATMSTDELAKKAMAALDKVLSELSK